MNNFASEEEALLGNEKKIGKKWLNILVGIVLVLGFVVVMNVNRNTLFEAKVNKDKLVMGSSDAVMSEMKLMCGNIVKDMAYAQKTMADSFASNDEMVRKAHKNIVVKNEAKWNKKKAQEKYHLRIEELGKRKVSCNNLAVAVGEQLNYQSLVQSQVISGSSCAPTAKVSYTFDSLKESSGKYGDSLDLKVFNGAKIANGVLILQNSELHSFAVTKGNIPFVVSEKTLEVYVKLTSLDFTGSGPAAFSIDQSYPVNWDGQYKSYTHQNFDAITYARITPRVWMPGSVSGARTESNGAAIDGSDLKEFVQWVIVYKNVGGNAHMTMYKNGEIYGTPYTKGAFHDYVSHSRFLFGKRTMLDWVATLSAEIDEAHFYDHALTQDQVKCSLAAYKKRKQSTAPTNFPTIHPTPAPTTQAPTTAAPTTTAPTTTAAPTTAAPTTPPPTAPLKWQSPYYGRYTTQGNYNYLDLGVITSMDWKYCSGYNQPLKDLAINGIFRPMGLCAPMPITRARCHFSLHPVDWINRIVVTSAEPYLHIRMRVVYTLAFYTRLGRHINCAATNLAWAPVGTVQTNVVEPPPEYKLIGLSVQAGNCIDAISFQFQTF